MKNSGNLNSNFFELLIKSWNLLKFELGKKGINQIQIYLNMIYQNVKDYQQYFRYNNIRKKKILENTIQQLY